MTKVALLTCIEERLHSLPNLILARFARKNGWKYYPVTRAGGVQDLVRPRHESDRILVYRDIAVALKHGAERIVIIGHEDCRGYDHFGFSDRAKELIQHHNDMLDASLLLSREFSGVRQNSFMALLEPDQKELFNIIPSLYIPEVIDKL
jgi:carbonic anhydrase